MSKYKLHKPKKILISFCRTGFCWTPYLNVHGLIWKDKWNTPRAEIVPTFLFNWLGMEIWARIGTEDEWEWWLWLHKYNNGRLRSALSSWPWREMK